MDYQAIYNLVKRTRSTRRFKAVNQVSIDILRDLVALARLTPSARNLQPLRYILVADSHVGEELFNCLAWAAALKKWRGPSLSERPTAYIVILGDRDLHKNIDCDHGIAAQTMMLGAASLGLGACMVASIQRNRLKKILGIDDRYDILLVMAFGVPDETVVIEKLPQNGNINYWRDKNDVHHVPKRELHEVILKTFP